MLTDFYFPHSKSCLGDSLWHGIQKNWIADLSVVLNPINLSLIRLLGSWQLFIHYISFLLQPGSPQRLLRQIPLYLCIVFLLLIFLPIYFKLSKCLFSFLLVKHTKEYSIIYSWKHLVLRKISPTSCVHMFIPQNYLVVNWRSSFIDGLAAKLTKCWVFFLVHIPRLDSSSDRCPPMLL